MPMAGSQARGTSPTPAVSAASPTPTAAAAGPPNLRKRTRTACTRCKNRKQKCDDLFPACSNCLRAGADCDKANVANETIPVSYTRALEEHVAVLEHLLADKGVSREDREKRLDLLRRSQLPVSTDPPAQSPILDPAPDAIPPADEDEAEEANEADDDEGINIESEVRDDDAGEIKDGDALDELVGIFSLGNFQGPAYVGPSSGLSLAMNLGEIVQASVWRHAMPEIQDDQTTPGTTNLTSDSPGWRASSSVAGKKRGRSVSRRRHCRAMTIDELVKHSVKEPPSDALGSRLIDAYFNQLHTRYPFLNAVEIRKLHHDRIDWTASATKKLPMTRRYGIFKLYMVYGIGATLLQLVEKRAAISPESFYSTALQHVTAAKESRTIQNIEAMTLLAIYHLRSASAPGLWYMTGLAMRSCIDLGLHRKGDEYSLSHVEVQWRRRLFWTVYSLERTIAISLGRPLSISDRQIDVDLPSVRLESVAHIAYSTSPVSLGVAAATPPSTATPKSSRASNTGDGDNIEIAIHMFRLRQIESRIHHSIYRTDKPLSVLRPKLDKHLEALQAWKDELFNSVSPSDKQLLDYPMLQYHRAVRLLIHPFLTLLGPSDVYYSLCLQAAGNICQAHKRLHQTPDYGHSFIAVQTVFVSGVTLVYGLWTHGHDAWTVTLADDVRACSLVLFVMSERATWVRKYRDAFEILVNAAMEKLRNGSSGLAEMAAAHQERQNQCRAKRARCSQRPSDEEQVGYEQRPPPPLVVDPMMYNLAGNSADELNGEPYDPRQSSFPWEPQLGIDSEGEESEDVWRVVMELANWIDQDQDTALMWMPNFEDL